MLVWLTVLCRLLAIAQCVIVSEVRSVCSTINMPRKCVNSSDAFCYICGEVTFKSRRRSFTPLFKKCCEHYFGCKVGDQDKSWALHFCCVTYARRLAVWAKVSRHSYGLERAHGPCFTLLLLPDSITGVTAKSKHTVQYPNLPSAMRPVPHRAGLRTCAKASNKQDAEWQWIKLWRCRPS